MEAAEQPPSTTIAMADEQPTDPDPPTNMTTSVTGGATSGSATTPDGEGWTFDDDEEAEDEASSAAPAKTVPHDTRDITEWRTHYGQDWHRGQVVWYDIKERGKVVESKTGRIHAFSQNLPPRDDRAKVKVELVEEIVDKATGECLIADVFFKSLRPSGAAAKSAYPSTIARKTVTIDSDEDKDSEGDEGNTALTARKRRTQGSDSGSERDRKRARGTMTESAMGEAIRGAVSTWLTSLGSTHEEDLDQAYEALAAERKKTERLAKQVLTLQSTVTTLRREALTATQKKTMQPAGAELTTIVELQAALAAKDEALKVSQQQVAAYQTVVLSLQQGPAK